MGRVHLTNQATNAYIAMEHIGTTVDIFGCAILAFTGQTAYITVAYIFGWDCVDVAGDVLPTGVRRKPHDATRITMIWLDEVATDCEIADV